MLRVPDRRDTRTVSPAQLHACETEMGGGCGCQREWRRCSASRSTMRTRYWNVTARVFRKSLKRRWRRCYRPEDVNNAAQRSADGVNLLRLCCVWALCLLTLLKA
ncbi:uncharacterized protein V6R79_018318 [Siganus canaliculatus]